MTLLEILVVLAIMVLAASGLSFSVGALARANLRAGAGKIGGATRYAYNRAVTNGKTVRIRFTVPGNSFSIEEAHAGVTLARNQEKEEKQGKGKDQEGEMAAAVDPWASAKALIDKPLEPSFGASPFSPIGSDSESGKAIARYTNVPLGRNVQIVKLIVAHEPEPLTQGEGSVHFFPGGMTEHAVIQLSDGHQGVYSVEIHPLTGRIRVYPKAYEPDALLDNPDEKDVSEVDAP
jgi:general secretion pathway protein H